MSNTPTLLSVKNLKKYFPMPQKALFQKRPYLRAVENVSLEIRQGETFGLVGESGCGKSTLGRTLLQLYRPTDGEVVYYGRMQDGEDLTKLKPKQLRALRKDLQIIFQDPYSSLNPRMTVGQLIEEGVATHGFYKRGSAEMKAYIVKVMKDCGLQEYALHRYPHQFSGGQRQRIGIARALAVRPKFVVCDECVSALDVSIQSQILNLLTERKEKEGLTYLFISHDLSVVRHVSDRIGVMYLGAIVEQGSTEQIFSSPRHPYTIALISAIPTLPTLSDYTGTELTQPTEKSQRILLPGSMPSPVFPPSGCPFHTRCFMAQKCCERDPAPVVEVEKGHFVACHFAQKSTREKQETAKRNAKMMQK